MEEEVGSLSYWQKNRKAESGSARILIIEDNQASLQLMQYVLTAFGYVTDTARNGREGLEKARLAPPDLIICDLEMPEMNGYEFALQKNSRAEFKEIPLIAVTAYAMVGDREKVLAAGFEGYVSKPISPETFVKQIESFFSERKRASGVPTTSAIADAPARPAQPKYGAILLVDDSAINRDLICSTLEPAGYTVTAFETVPEALAHAVRDSFDLIISDLHIPVTNGIEFLQVVKSDCKLRSIPFLLCTASYSGGTTSDIEALACELNAEFVNRPIEARLLLSKVDSILQVQREGPWQNTNVPL